MISWLTVSTVYGIEDGEGDILVLGLLKTSLFYFLS